ncbi:hypothetical protein PENFLA_c010G04758 [Penicillium flavigenum]|uniref:Uncharacterized protein n=1 Tax=Penicillium flavigenum TaxID=254877 RepID=A0A1V6TCK7_9EURO|nr:hypothetical protein PENFLA_c010G04758 [Penicillium flavigenum]
MLTQRSETLDNWGDTYRPGPLGGDKPLYQVLVAFDFLQIIILLGLLAAAILIRKRRMQRGIILFKSLNISLLSSIIAPLLAAIVECIDLTGTKVKRAYGLANLLQHFAGLFSLCTIFFLFYRLINHFQERSTGRSPTGLIVLHGVFLGLMAAICVADWTLYVGYSVITSLASERWGIYCGWVQCARQIVFWVASLEVVIWALFVTVRTFRIDRQARASVFSFLLSSIGFFAMNLMWAIITIQWDIIAYLAYPRWVSYFEPIFRFGCTVITYFGVLLCCTRLAGLEDFKVFSTEGPSVYPMVKYQHPYAVPSEMESSQHPHAIPSEMESRQMIMEADPSREFWEAGSRPIHEADAESKIGPPKP